MTKMKINNGDKTSSVLQKKASIMKARKMS